MLIFLEMYAAHVILSKKDTFSKVSNIIIYIWQMSSGKR